MPRKIIYVDDDTDDLLFFEMALQKVDPSALLQKFSNPEIFTGKLAEIEATESLIFLDINMPLKNGFQVLKEIRQKYSAEKLPVIMLSTSDNENTITVAREFGASAYAVKPNDISDLINLLKKLLTKDWHKSSPGKDGFLYSR